MPLKPMMKLYSVTRMETSEFLVMARDEEHAKSRIDDPRTATASSDVMCRHSEIKSAAWEVSLWRPTEV